MTRVQRKQILVQMRKDEVVSQLANERQNQLIKLLNQLYSFEERSITKAQRFGAESIQDIYIEVENRSTDTPENI